MGIPRNSLLRVETQGAAQRTTKHTLTGSRGVSEHATQRFARKMDL